MRGTGESWRDLWGLVEHLNECSRRSVSARADRRDGSEETEGAGSRRIPHRFLKEIRINNEKWPESHSHKSLEIGADDLDEIFGGLTPGVHMITNMVFHKLAHKAVDCASCSRKTVKHISTWRMLIQSSKN
jgi:hypothetical protein